MKTEKNTIDISDLDIQACVDGELHGDTAISISSKIFENPKLKKKYEQYKHQNALLQRWWKSLEQQ